MFLGEDLDIYRRLIPRYFPSADEYDLKHESSEQQGDGEEEGKEVKEKDLHGKDDEGEANEKLNREEEPEGLYVCLMFVNSKAFNFCLDYFVCISVSSVNWSLCHQRVPSPTNPSPRNNPRC